MATWIKVANVTDVAPGQRKMLELQGKKVGLIRTAAGEFFAIEDRCTHDDGPLAEGEIVGSTILCPRHGAKFDLATGKALTLPAFGCTGHWRVAVEGNDVKVEIE